MKTPFGEQYMVLRWDLYVSELFSSEVINDPYGLGFVDLEGFQKIEDRYFYFVKYGNLIFGRDVTPSIKLLHSIRILFIIAILIIALSVFLSTFLLSQQSISDLKNFVNDIENLGGSNVSYRSNVKPKSFEVRELISKFNDLMSRIERSYKAEESFVSAVSHELRTPVANLLGYINMLKRWGIKDENTLQEAVKSIEESAIEIKNIIENMLLIARVETLTAEQINLKEFVKEIVNQKFKDKEIEIINSGNLYTNKEGLGIILTILIENAFKHGAPPVTIRLSDDAIEVENHGERIPEEDLDKIFNRLYKGSNSNGLGLGLYIAKEIATKLGLNILVNSDEHATIFKITKQSESQA